MSRDRSQAREAFRPLLEAEARQAGLNLAESCLDRLEAHYKLLIKWNRAVRLLGDTNPDIVVRRHVLESLLLLPFIHEPRGALLDVGSGNGFPAIPLKCALDDLRLGMVEPTRRKSLFLSAIISELRLAETEVHRMRVDRPRDLTRLGKWDCITMRAVAAIPAVVEGAPAALREGGRVLLLVGEAGRAEALARVSAPLEVVAEERLPGKKSSYLLVIGLPTATHAERIH